jgi:nucleotide-binding universal stress UspA family protein
MQNLSSKRAIMNVVLVPIDGSQASLRALALALKEVSAAREPVVHLLNVQPPPLHPWPGKLVSPDDIEAELHRRGMQILHLAQGLTEGRHAKIKTHVRVGRAADEIVRCAEQEDCEFIVMGTRGLVAAGTLALSAVSTRVVHLSRIPVILTR